LPIKASFREEHGGAWWSDWNSLQNREIFLTCKC
jgi:hypothetical protein